MAKSRAELILDQVRDLVNSGYLDDPTLRDMIAGQFDVPTEELHTSKRVKELAAKGLRAPYKLDDEETQELCGSVMAHITRHNG